MPQPIPGPQSLEDEVLANIQAQQVGAHTVANYHLPEPFLRAVADRVIRASFRERHRRVVRALHGEHPQIEQSLAAAAPGASTPAHVSVLRPTISDERLRYQQSIPEARPPLRGYRAPILAAPDLPPFHPPADPALHAAAALVARRLSADGLLGTLARLIELLGLARTQDPDLLIRVGFPIDLLDHFVLHTGERGRDLVRLCSQPQNAAARAELLRSARFDFQPTRRGFAARLDGIDEPIQTIRIQLSSARMWGGLGAGNGPDVLRQLLQMLPHATCLAAIDAEHAEALARLAAPWCTRPGQLTIIPSPLHLSQWAQDNAIPGTRDGRPFLLFPRFASRGEEGSILIPGETFIADAFAAAEIAAAQSPLLFQGGNLLLVQDPRTGQRILLAGEAEIHRNTVLGLTRDQASEALRLELGADRIVILPAVSFHIDFDVLPWTRESGVIAFVNDPLAAACEILRCGLLALHRAGLLDHRTTQQLEQHLQAGRLAAAAPILAQAVFSTCLAPGAFPDSLAQHFASAENDSGPGNLVRFLLAVDMAMAAALPPERLAPDPHLRAYLKSFRRGEQLRRQLHTALAGLGWRTVRIPSISDSELSLNYLNGLRDGNRYLMPAYGGLYAPLDQAAAAVISREADAQVVPILTGETQRRSGGLHCAVGWL